MPSGRWIARFIVGCGFLLAAGSLALAAADVGHPAPKLVASLLDGQKFDLEAMRGKVVLVNYWATWCVPCREEMPALNAFYQRYHDQGLEMIGISADSFRDRGDVVKMAKTLAYPVATLRQVSPNGFGPPRDLPTTFVIDRTGIVQLVMTPDKTPVTEQSLAQLVLPLLVGH